MGVLRNWWLCVFLLWSSAVVAGPVMSHPDVSLGENPIRNFSGEVDHGETVTLMTVPDGQDFVITGMLQPHNRLQIKQNEEVLVPQWASGLLGNRLLTVKVESGRTLSVEHVTASMSSESFYLQGYFTPTGGPQEFFVGMTGVKDLDEVLREEVWRNESEQTFVVRYFYVNVGDRCGIYLDDALVFAPGGALTANHYLPQDGRLTFLVPTGSTLKIEAGYTAHCKYIMSGEYMQP